MTTVSDCSMLTLSGPKIRIIVPSKNEATRIGKTLEAFCAYFGDRAVISVVANGCTDSTVQIVRSLQQSMKNLKLQIIPDAIGKGGAVRAGLKLGTEAFVAYVDADGSTTPEQIQYLLDKCDVHGLDGAIGSRWSNDSLIEIPQPLARRIASRAFNLMVRAVLHLEFRDTQCGAKVFRRDAIDSVLQNLEIANFAFDIDLLLTLVESGYQVREFGISWSDFANGSQVSLKKAAPAMLLALLRLRVRHSWLRNIPFLDLVGRSTAIPVKSNLRILLLHNGNDEFDNYAKAQLQESGHIVCPFRLASISDILKFSGWYIREGNKNVDVIVDQTLSGVVRRALRFSSKPKISLNDDTTLQMPKYAGRDSQLSNLAAILERRLNYLAIFKREAAGWVLTRHDSQALSLNLEETQAVDVTSARSL